ncbi:hypothetical protein LOTGIDRAFT_235498 [Lottia gigantea]|uniref:DUF19 domain-containing protein n=1 Tax=Lottia gigantea TaxID=225164 RepID=V3Z667_LOTGI|nr:hypothetical protein LOTGIDRAFT_235498 [Lottia gigantea]ESO86273.1 hypothetical protein LOTGIDRAFT_235498 [Lottia gigantea]
MAVYLNIVLVLAGVVCLASGDTYGEFKTCQMKASSDCTKSSSDFSNLDSNQISNFFQEKDNSFCNKKAEFSKLLVCFYDAQRSCLMDEDKNILATAEEFTGALDYYCSRVMNDTNNFNLTCVMDSKCGQEKPSDSEVITDNSTLAEYKVQLCSQFESGVPCYGEKLESCPATKETLMEIMKLVKPAACSGTSIFYNSVLIFFSFYLFKFFM